MRAPASLLVTLRLDDEATAYFEKRRRKYFPPQRNRVPAHVMLFHRLPLLEARTVASDLERVARSLRRFDLDVAPPHSIGTGVSYDLIGDDLLRARASLASAWDRDLIAQDRERYRPHVVVQNKVDRPTVRTTLAILLADFKPFTVRATGFELWRYDNGYWDDPSVFPISD